VSPTDSAQQLPQRIENAINRRASAGKIFFPDFTSKELTFDRRMLAIGFDVHGEIAITLWIVEMIMPDESVDL
jgi:hypothetical protein